MRPGDLLHAVLQTAIDSDEPGPVRARVVGERFEGGILLGALEKLAAPVASRSSTVSSCSSRASTARSASLVGLGR